MKFILIAFLLVTAGCAQPPQQPIYSSAKDREECRYEAAKASPIAPSSFSNLGAAVGASAAREGELYQMCLRMRSNAYLSSKPAPHPRPQPICEKAVDGIVDCRDAK